jgi:hypothetical protein
MPTGDVYRGLMNKERQSEERLLRLVNDFLTGSFTMASEQPMAEEIIRLLGLPVSVDDVLDTLFDGTVETPEQGVAALRSLPRSS